MTRPAETRRGHQKSIKLHASIEDELVRVHPRDYQNRAALADEFEVRGICIRHAKCRVYAYPPTRVTKNA